MNLQTNNSGSSISIELPEETASAISTFGDVNKIYGNYVFPEDLKTGSKFINGQIISSEGKELLFNSVLVEYSKLFDNNKAVQYTMDIRAANALMHHRYDGMVYDPEKTYIEFSTYYNLTDHNIAYIEIRVFDGNFMETYYTDYWYAKSVTFSPDLKYDIRNYVNILTGEHEKYDWISKTAEPSDYSESEYNTDGYLTKSTTYYPNGNIHYKWLYDGTESNKLIMRVDHDNSGIKTCEYEFDEDGRMSKKIKYNASGIKTYEYEYDEDRKATKKVLYDESGNKTSECKYEYDENGKLTKHVCYDMSGNKTSECKYEYDENGQPSKKIGYDASGNKTYECEYDENGMVTKQIWYDES